MPTGPQGNRRAIVLSIALLPLVSGAASAGFIASTWQGPDNGNWNVAANWSSNRVPDNTAADTFGATINSGTVNLDLDKVTVDQFTFAGGLLDASELRFLTVQKSASWTSGTLGRVAVTTKGTLAIGPVPMGSSSPTLRGFLDTKGATTLSGGNLMAAGGIATVNNSGTFTIPDDSGIKSAAAGAPFVFNNSENASLVKSGGTGTSRVDGFTSNNGGTIQVKSGTLSFGSLSQSDGTTRVDQGATLISTTDFNIRGGQLTGLGTVQAPNVLNGGKLKATLAQGAKLTIAANLDDLGGGTVTTFDSAVGGPWSSDPDYNSTVEVTGDTLLGGILEVERWPGYIPPPDHEFDILISDGSLTGSFENVADGQRITTTDGFGSFLVHYESTGFEHVVALTDFERDPAVPEPSALVLWLLGAALVGVRLRWPRVRKAD